MRCIILFYLVFCTGFSVYATHIVGGEINYECLGNNNYRIVLTVYRDCFNGSPDAPFDPVASIGIFDTAWRLVRNQRVAFVKDDTLPIILSNPCLSVPPNVCVHRSTYTTTINLPFRNGGYHIAYQRCCRNQLIRNIPNPLAVGATYYAYLSEAALHGCNTSARFNNWPPVAICVNEPIVFDHSASDKEGDSLVYRLCAPLEGADQVSPKPDPPNTGPYIPVTWLGPLYSLNNVLGGVPLAIDPRTGLLTGTPNTLGNFVVGICVDEYRDGVLISTTRRDFQYNVANCGVPTAAFFVPEIVCNTLTVSFDNQSTRANTYRWTFGSGNASSTLAKPVFTYPDTGKYTVRLIVEPGAVCSDTFERSFHLKKTTLSAADAQIQKAECTATGGSLLLTDQSTAPGIGIAARDWLVTGPGGFLGRSSETTPTFPFTEPGMYSVRLIVTAADGCKDTSVVRISSPVPPALLLRDSVRFCPDNPVHLFPDFVPGFNYQWSPEDHLSDPRAGNPVATPPVATTYSVTITHPVTGCTRVAAILADPYPKFFLNASVSPDTILPGQSVRLTAVLPGGTSYQWSPPERLNDPNSVSTLAFPLETTTYTVAARTVQGCPLLDSVTVFVLRLGCEEPYVFFPTGFSPNGDGINDVLQLNVSLPIESVYWVIYNRWGQKVFEANNLQDAWDGNFKGVAQPADAFGYFLQVQCPGGEVFSKKGNVTLLR
jgi:gliding motility-associated-like protein